MSSIRVFRSPHLAAILAILVAAPSGTGLRAQTPAAKAAAPAAKTATPPAGTNADPGWPRTVKMANGSAEIYQPQVESWAGQKHIVAWSAVAYSPTAAKEPALGTIKLESNTKVSLDDRVVGFDAFKVTEYNFKTLSPAQAKTFASDVSQLPENVRVLDLDRVLAYVRKSPLNVKNVEGIKADPPKILSSTTPAVLVNLDGAPIWSPIKDLDLKFAVNTNWDLFQYGASNTLYLRDEQSWLQAPAIEGPWTAVDKLPPSFAKLPADDNWKEVKAAVPGKKFTAKTLPKVYSSTDPAELIKIDGAPNYLVVEGAPTLLWVSNTESDLFRMGKSGDYYYLVAGRWFKAADLAGPWTFATPTLPAEFTKISEEHPRSRVLASIPGTEQATEAVLLAQIPRTARVNKKEIKAPDVVIQGEPQVKAIDGSKGVQQVVNTDKDIFKIDNLYYMCYQAVWFVGKTATGPWEVAETVPQVIYSIPASAPTHHVTYVTVEDDDSSDEWVTFAYVAAYTGLMIGWGCAVWGSGYYYPPYGFGGMYYPYPHTYGMSAWYNPYTGGYGRGGGVYGPYGGVGMGSSYNPRTGTYARGATAYGPGGSRTVAQAYNPRTGAYGQTRQGSNVYGNWGTSSVQRGDDWAQTAHKTNYATGSRTTAGRTSEGAGAVSRTGQAGRTTVGRTEGGDIYAGHDGNVYKKGDNGNWQTNSGSGWSDTARQPTGDRTSELDRDANARAQGNQRAADRSTWQSGGSTRSGAGSYRGGGGGARAGGGGRRR
jgi:hypothetical protein